MKKKIAKIVSILLAAIFVCSMQHIMPSASFNVAVYAAAFKTPLQTLPRAKS